jgi:hypothetical protein
MGFDQEVMPGFTQPELQDAFDKVVPRDADWRGPIDGKCWECDKEAVRAAVIYFTATVPKFEELPGNQGHPALGFRYRVTALGYRMGPAG